MSPAGLTLRAACGRLSRPARLLKFYFRSRLPPHLFIGGEKCDGIHESNVFPKRVIKGERMIKGVSCSSRN